MPSRPGGNHPHKSQWLQIWLTTGNHLAAAVTRQMLLVDLKQNLDLDVMQYCHCTGSLLGGGFWWKHSSWHSCCHDSCCCSSVGWWNGKHSPSWDTHLEVKTLCWGQSHYGLLHTALSVAHANRASTINTESLLHEYKSKELGYGISWPGPSFPPGKTQGWGRMNNILHYSQHLTSIPISTYNQIQTKKQERKESEISFSY